MIRSPLLALLGFASLAGCVEPTAPSLSLMSAEEQQSCEAEREAARAEAGFRLQAVGMPYAGSTEAAFAQDIADAHLANDFAAAAFARCMERG